MILLRHGDPNTPYSYDKGTQTHDNQPRPGHLDDSCSMLFFASWFPHPEKQYFSKNQLSPEIHLQSSWKIWVKHFATHTQKKQGTKRVREIHQHGPALFMIHTKRFSSHQVQMTLSLGAAELFLPTLASKEAPHVLINGITQYQETQNGFERLGGRGN